MNDIPNLPDDYECEGQMTIEEWLCQTTTQWNAGTVSSSGTAKEDQTESRDA